MEILTDGLVTIFNGVYAVITGLAHPTSIAAIISAAALAWIGRLEMAELDRQGAKPRIVRH